MKRAWLGIAAVSLFGLAVGCKTIDQKSAQYHSWRAQRAADRGNYQTANQQQRKADEANKKLRTDPLP